MRLEQYREGQHGPRAENAYASAMIVHVRGCPVQTRAHHLIFVCIVSVCLYDRMGIVVKCV